MKIGFQVADLGDHVLGGSIYRNRESIMVIIYKISAINLKIKCPSLNHLFRLTLGIHVLASKEKLRQIPDHKVWFKFYFH